MKRFLYILAVFFTSLILVTGVLVAALMSDEVETAVVQLATAELSRTLGTKASVGRVSYHFPARLAIQDIYLEDRQHDTLAFVGEVYAHFKPLALRHNEIRFSHVRVRDGVLNIYQHPDSTWNYAFLLGETPAEQEQEQAKDPFRSLVAVQDIRLDNIRLRYQDYSVHLDHALMDLNHLTAASLDAQVSELKGQLADHSGRRAERFQVEDLKARLILNDSLLSMPTLRADLPNSHLDMSGIEVHFPACDTLYLSRSAHDISFQLGIHQAELVPSDIVFFVPSLSQFERPIALTGTVSGTLDSLAFKDIALRYNGLTVLEGDIAAIGLPDISNPYLKANFKDVHTNAAQLQDLLSQIQGQPVRLPDALHRLGDIHYRGLASGRLHDLTLHGAFRTALGTISTDGAFRSDSVFKHMTYDARIVGQRFHFGRMLNHAPLGTATVDIRTKGAIDNGIAHGVIKAHVRELTYNNYTFTDLDLDGQYDPKRYNGSFEINDPHLSLAFDGIVNLQDINPEMNFNIRCRHFDTTPLSADFLDRKPDLSTSFTMSVDLDGINIDRMNGYMVIDSLSLATPKDAILMRQMTLLVSTKHTGEDTSGLAITPKSIRLTSDYLTARLDGSFRYADLAPAVQALLHHYLPSAIDGPTKPWLPVAFTLTADGKNVSELQRLFTAPVTLADHPTLRATAAVYPDKDPSVNLRFVAPGLSMGNTPVSDLTLDLKTLPKALALAVDAETMQMHTILSTLAFHDSLITHLTLRQQAQLDSLLPEGWQNLSPRELQRALRSDLSGRERYQALLSAQRAGNYEGDIRLITHFSKYANRPLIDLHVMPSNIILRDSLYTLDESRVTYCAADTSIQVDHFAFEGAGQHLRAHGTASRRRTDTLAIDLRKINAAYVVPFVLPVQTIMFNGLLTGRANIASTLHKPQIDTRIHVDSMGLNNCHFGEAEVDLHIKDSLAFHADVFKPQPSDQPILVALDGKALFDGSGRWELNMDADQVPLEFINHWTAAVLKDLDGHGTGHITVGGRKGLVYVLLRCCAHDAHLTLPWTGARYTIPHDTIVMDTSAILFPNVHLLDVEGHPVELNGGISHTMFHNFKLDLHVDANNALVFDKEQKGEMIQGHVYAKGHVDVTGPDRDLLIVADAVTTRNSSFRLSLDKVASAYESNFVHFVNHADTLKANEEKKKAEQDTIYRPPGRVLMKLNLEVNPQLLFQLVLGERNGDIIQGRGNGALRLTYDTQTGAVSLLGTYDIDRGTLSYTVANVIRKEFTVGEGSTIVFSGDATNPQLDVTAKYKVVANLRDLFGDESSQIATSRSNIPVLTCLHLTGELHNPILSFALEFPTSDQTIQQQVRQVINTDEMLMRQVIYLLVFGRFFTPEYMSMAQYATLNSTYSLLSSTVTSQINAWLSKLTNVLTLGVAIRTEGEGAGSSQEYEAQFQLQPADRLVINGNVGYRYNDISNQPFFGDLDVEVLLTEDGQVRLKGYTHTVDKYSLRQASTIQGFGLMWKKDFNWPEKKKKDKTPTDSVSAPSISDTLRVQETPSR